MDNPETSEKTSMPAALTRYAMRNVKETTPIGADGHDINVYETRDDDNGAEA